MSRLPRPAPGRWSPPGSPPPAAGLSRRALLRASVAGALLGSGALLSGCAAPLRSSDPTALRVWDLFQGGDGMLMDDMIKAVSKGSKGSKGFSIDRTILDWGPSYYTKLAMSAAGGRASDVAAMHLSRLAGYAPGGLLDPFDEELLAEFGVREEHFAPAVWKQVFQEGKLYAVPLDTHPFIVFYDRDAADRAGLLDSDGELAPMGSPEALLEANAKLAEATGTSGILYGHVNDTAQNWRLFAGLYAQTGSTFDLPDGGPPQIDTDAAVRVAKFMKQLVDGRRTPNNLDYDSASAAFMGGRGGMIMIGEWELPSYRELDMTLGAASFPQVFERPAVYADAHSFVLPRQQSPDPDRRRETHRYVAEMVKQSLTWATAGHIPAWQPVMERPAYGKLRPQSSYAVAGDIAVFDPPNWFVGAGSTFQQRMSQPLQAMLLGSSTPENAVRRMVKECDTLLKQPNPVT